jgi:hypothetical protein
MNLTPEELHDITGYVQPAAQKRWLKKNKIKFHENRYGHPKVDRAYYTARLAAPQQRSGGSPNWAALESA